MMSSQLMVFRIETPPRHVAADYGTAVGRGAINRQGQVRGSQAVAGGAANSTGLGRMTRMRIRFSSRSSTWILAPCLLTTSVSLAALHRLAAAVDTRNNDEDVDEDPGGAGSVAGAQGQLLVPGGKKPNPGPRKLARV